MGGHWHPTSSSMVFPSLIGVTEAASFLGSWGDSSPSVTDDGGLGFNPRDANSMAALPIGSTVVAHHGRGRALTGRAPGDRSGRAVPSDPSGPRSGSDRHPDHRRERGRREPTRRRGSTRPPRSRRRRDRCRRCGDVGAHRRRARLVLPADARLVRDLPRHRVLVASAQLPRGRAPRPRAWWCWPDSSATGRWPCAPGSCSPSCRARRGRASRPGPTHSPPWPPCG